MTKKQCRQGEEAVARFVIANRRAGKFHETEKRAARAMMERSVASIASSVNVLADDAPSDELARRVMVVEAEPVDVAAMLGHPDVLVEPEILHYREVVKPTDFAEASRAGLAAPVPAGVRTITVNVRGGGQPLRGAMVFLFLRPLFGDAREMKQTTGANGRVSFTFPASLTASALTIVPAGNFWTMVIRGPSSTVNVNCLRLPTGRLGWWHRALGQATFNANRGAGIRVGVADTGVGPHPALAHVADVGAFIDGQTSAPPAGRDVDSHGSHVCGTIGARPTGAGQFGGIAPGANLFSARVFPNADDGANQGDIARAIDALSRTHRVDLINLSLGAEVGSAIERDAIQDALERGTLTICAAGNSRGAVEFPGAFEQVVGVSALGQLGTAPAGTLSASRVPGGADRHGVDNLFLANFSCFGPEIDCSGPGVAVIATVPERFGLIAPYGGMDGTSMASPAAVGATAVLLSQSATYAALPRDITRAEMARTLLKQACRVIGLHANFQGNGLPTL